MVLHSGQITYPSFVISLPDFSAALNELTPLFLLCVYFSTRFQEERAHARARQL